MCRAGDLDIALLNAVVSALSRAAQWQQARVKNDVEVRGTRGFGGKKIIPFLGNRSGRWTILVGFICLWNCTWDV